MTAVTDSEEALTPPGGAPPKGDSKKIEFTWPKILVGVIVLLLVIGVGAYGAIGSYETIRALAAGKGIKHPELVPIGVDGALFTMIVFDLFLTWLGYPMRMLRLSARGFTLATVLVNGMAAIHTKSVPGGEPVLVVEWDALILHIFAPLALLVACESVRGWLLKLLGKEDLLNAYEALGWVCWVTQPIKSFKTWKRMRISRIRRYSDAEDFEARRRAAVARLRTMFGTGFVRWGGWHRHAPSDIVWGLRNVTRPEVLDSLCKKVSMLTGTSEDGPSGSRNPRGIPSGGGAGNPGGRSPGTLSGNGSGTPHQSHREPGGRGASPVGGRNGNRTGNSGGTEGTPSPGNPSGGGEGNGEDVDLKNPPRGTRDEIFAWRLARLDERYPDTVPGINRVIRPLLGVGAGTAMALRDALCVKRGIPAPSEQDSQTDLNEDPFLVRT